MKKHKAELYEELSKNKASPEFLQYFYTYDPRDTLKQRQTKRRELQKTRKQRTTA
jgi:hypothetical protein